MGGGFNWLRHRLADGGASHEAQRGEIVILWLHVAGGVVTLLFSAAVILRSLQGGRVANLRVGLPLLAGWQTGTGALLLVGGGSFLRVCGMGLLYLTAIAGVYVWSERRDLKLAYETHRRQ